MRKLILLLGAMAYMLASCGSKQDPMSGKPDEVQNGRLPQQKVQLPVPAKSDAVRVNAVKSVTFKETVEGRIPIVANVLEKDYDLTLEIVNGSDFPGATLDPETNEFVWTPPKGFIFGGIQQDDTWVS